MLKHPWKVVRFWVIYLVRGAKKNEATEPVRSDTKLRLQNFAAEELFQDHDFITAFCQCSGQPQASHTTADDNIIQILQKFFLRLLEGWL